MDGLLSKKNLITYLVLAIIVLAIPLSLRLLQTRIQFFPKAAGDEVTCPNLQTQGENCISKTSNVELRINSPWGPPQ